MSEHQQTLDVLAMIVDRLDRNIEATTRLAEAIANIGKKTPEAKARAEAAVVIEKAAAPVAEVAPANPTPSATITPISAPVTPAAATETTHTATATRGATYEDARAVIATIPRTKAVEILKSHGVAKLSEITDAATFYDIIGACRAVA